MSRYVGRGDPPENTNSEKLEGAQFIQQKLQNRYSNLVQNQQEDFLTDVSNCTPSISFMDLRFEKSPDLDAIVKNLVTKISSSGMSKDKEETVIELLETLKKHQLSFLKNQFLFNTIRDCSAGDNPQKPSLDKAGRIIALEELSSYVSCNSTAECNLLGIRLKAIPSLTPDETQELRYVAQEKVVERCAQIKCQMYDSGTRSAGWLPLTEDEEIITEANKVLGESVKAYNAAALAYLDEIQAMWQVCDQSRIVALNNMDWIEKRCCLLQLRTRILERKVLLAFYSEEPHQVEALEVLSNILKEKIQELRAELKKLKATITQYNKLKGTEYDTVLEEYRNTLRKLEEKVWVLDKMLKN